MQKKASIELVLLAIALTYLEEGGAQGQAIQASIQLPSHYVAMAAQALSGVKISHCSERGLMWQHTHKHTCWAARGGAGEGDLFILF